MPATLKNAVISATALVALVQLCPAPFLAAIPAATAAGIGAASAAVSAAAAVGGTVATAVQAGKSNRLMRREQLAQRSTDFEDYKVIAARQEQNQLAWDLCHQQLGSASLTFSGPSPGNVLVQGMPPACMTLATVITGEFNVGTPVPQGSDSMLFQNLSDEDIQEIQNALDSHP
ncbi:unnamed protein product [Discula destructiva]